MDELKQALVETLESRGVLGQVKAKIRSEIFAALDDELAPRLDLERSGGSEAQVASNDMSGFTKSYMM